MSPLAHAKRIGLAGVKLEIAVHLVIDSKVSTTFHQRARVHACPAWASPLENTMSVLIILTMLWQRRRGNLIFNRAEIDP
jgi:hypothetical protein